MKHIFLAAIVTLFLQAASAQKIQYIVSFPNAIHHEAHIELHAFEIPKGKAIFRMSRSSPGRYATHEFGKNIYDIQAFDRNNKQVAINRIEPDVYEVPQQDGFVRVIYTLYADYPDGTYAGVDESSIQLNMPATFLWMKGMDKAPIRVEFKLPAEKGLTIATQLKPTAESNVFTAPGLQYFMDSPVKIGHLIMREWKATNTNGQPLDFRLALEADASDAQADAMAKKVERITKEAKAVYGEWPSYDYGMYTFLASINPWVKGDGMEHRNSTMIARPVPFSDDNRQLGVFAHEFFHCWNVERIRPKSLEPFNFEHSNMSAELWFAEGFTQYYGGLLMLRSGLVSREDALRTFAGLINTKVNTPGGRNYSPAANSQNAVFVDAGVSIDRNNYVNNFASYYPLGGAIALALELELRTRFAPLTLDDYMTAAWKKFGKTEIPYTIDGLEQVLADLTGDNTFASDFFNSYVRGHQAYDYAASMAKAGLWLIKSHPGTAWAGNVRFTKEKDGLSISSNTVIGTPLYKAGLDVDDEILSIGQQNINKEADLAHVLQQHQPGDTLSVIYRHHNINRNTLLVVEEDPYLTVLPLENSGQPVPDTAKKIREAWLSAKAE